MCKIDARVSVGMHAAIAACLEQIVYERRCINGDCERSKSKWERENWEQEGERTRAEKSTLAMAIYVHAPQQIHDHSFMAVYKLLWFYAAAACNVQVSVALESRSYILCKQRHYRVPLCDFYGYFIHFSSAHHLFCTFFRMHAAFAPTDIMCNSFSCNARLVLECKIHFAMARPESECDSIKSDVLATTSHSMAILSASQHSPLGTHSGKTLNWFYFLK